jgi:hypothetical protein
MLPAVEPLLFADTRGHEAVPAAYARTSTNAGLDPLATHVLVATSATVRGRARRGSDREAPVP